MSIGAPSDPAAASGDLTPERSNLESILAHNSITVIQPEPTDWFTHTAPNRDSRSRSYSRDPDRTEGLSSAQNRACRNALCPGNAVPDACVLRGASLTRAQ